MNPVDFETTLTETATWCGSTHSRQNNWRSPGLNPFRDYPDGRDPSLIYIANTVRNALTNELVSLRRKHLFNFRAEPGSLRDARLLLLFPDDSDRDGLSMGESNNYFDVYDTPPWDTWITYVDAGADESIKRRNFLVSLVFPESFNNVEKGIEVAVLQCLCWLDKAPDYVIIPEWLKRYATYPL